MKKIILIALLTLGVLFIVGCGQQTAEDEVFGSDALAGQATATEQRECKANPDCRQSVMDCYNAECRALRGAGRRECIDSCFDRVLAGEEEAEESNFCAEGSECGFVTTEQLDGNDESLSFGGCPRGTTASACINNTHAFCTGSAELGDHVISCGPPGSCSGNYPAGGCWGVPRGRQASDSHAFGGCPRGSTSSVCVNDDELFCMGSDEFGDQTISCGAGNCAGEFPSARCA